jgi:pyruvate, water dikinase
MPTAPAAKIMTGSGIFFAAVRMTRLRMAMSVVARQRGNYLPELSFGTHFFQDLVEASIRYLPLYPDDPTTVFNELFFRRSCNVLDEVLPEFSRLAETLRVTDVPLETGGLILRVLMNADLDQAVGFLASPQQKIGFRRTRG